jgi:hypothetical protein
VDAAQQQNGKSFDDGCKPGKKCVTCQKGHMSNVGVGGGALVEDILVEATPIGLMFWGVLCVSVTHRPRKSELRSPDEGVCAVKNHHKKSL